MIKRLLGYNKILERALDASWLRNEVITNNLANVDTPGYKRQTVEFERFLTDAIGKKKTGYSYTTHEKHFPIGGQDGKNIPVRVKEDFVGNQMRLDGNSVDIDVEMAELSKNNIYYNAITQQLSRQFNMIKSAIIGR